MITKKILKEFYLLTVFFNVKNEERLNDYLIALNKNIDNYLIKKIFLFYELLPNEKIEYDMNINPKINIIPIYKKTPRTITFQDLFKYANQHLNNKYIIIANNDIFFDNTLNLINLKDNDFLAISRNQYYDFKEKKNPFSQDAWIFKTPIKYPDFEIPLGWLACENILAYCMEQLNYNVYNPSLDIQIYHVQKILYTPRNKYFKFDLSGLYPMKFLSLDHINKNSNQKMPNLLNNNINSENLSTLNKNAYLFYLKFKKIRKI